MDLTASDGVLMGISAITTAVGTQFFNYLRQRRQDLAKQEGEEDDRVVAGYQLTIAKMEAQMGSRISALEKAYDKMFADHIDCITIQAELRGEIAALHKQMGNNPDITLPSAKPPPIAPPPHRNSPQITPHNTVHQQIPNVPTRSIEPLDQK